MNYKLWINNLTLNYSVILIRKKYYYKKSLKPHQKFIIYKSVPCTSALIVLTIINTGTFYLKILWISYIQSRSSSEPMPYFRATYRSLTNEFNMHAYSVYHGVVSISRLVVLYLFSFIHISLARTSLMVTRVGSCYGEPRTIITVSEFSLSTKPFKTSLTGDMNITENIEDGWSVKATMKKCLDIRNIDTCDHFKSFPYIRDGCVGYQEDDEAIYSILFHSVEPRLSCPIEAGRYIIKDFPLHTEDTLAVYESKISTSVFGYTFRLDCFDKLEQKILCVEAYLQLLYIREHSWVKGKKDVASILTTTETASAENDIQEYYKTPKIISKFATKNTITFYTILSEIFYRAGCKVVECITNEHQRGKVTYIF